VNGSFDLHVSVKTHFAAQRKAILPLLDGGGTSRIAQRSGGGTNCEFQTPLKIPAFVQAQQESRAKRIAGAGGADDLIGGHANGRLQDRGLISGDAQRAFWQMNDHGIANPAL
jgi:hypothetical protein